MTGARSIDSREGKQIRFQTWPHPVPIEDVISAKELEAGLIDPDGLKAAVTELESGPYTEDSWSKLVEVITLDQAARAFLR